MAVTFVKLPGLAGPRLVGTLMGITGALLMLLGNAMKVVTVGRFGLNVSVSIRQLSEDAGDHFATAVGFALVAIVVAQIPYLRFLALVTGGVGVGAIGMALWALDRAQRPQDFVELAAVAAGNPRPAAGFFVLLLGGVLALLGALTTLVSRRQRFVAVAAPVPQMPSVEVLPSQAGTGPAASATGATAIGLPITTPGWFPDPAGSSSQRWWTGRSWSDPLPPPTPPMS
jgi:hypothetical protein